MLFSETGLHPHLLSAVTDLGFTTPTPIQQLVIPKLVENPSDMLALAQTGTGKTAAFGLPLLHHLNLSETKFPQILVVSPTRELCIQIANDFEAFSKYLPNYRQAVVYGGIGIRPQMDALKRGVHVIIATPGRLMDLIDRGYAKLDQVTTVVLDEADEMLNMGFREDMENILSYTPASRRTWLFSATMPDAIRGLVNKFMKSPLEISAGKRNVSAENVTHGYAIVRADEKYEALKRIVDTNPTMYAIIFTRTKAEAQDITEKLIRENYDIEALHGDLSQQQRDKVMQRFREKSLQLLIATDVAARGIDVEALTHVINYGLPEDPEIYTHRSGRTGRAGRSGICISILHEKEKGKLRSIEKFIGKTIERVLLPTGKEICENQFLHLIDRLKNSPEPHGDFENYIPLVLEQLHDMDKDELIRRIAALEFNRIMEYYKNARDLNRERTRNEPGADGSQRIFFNCGVKDGLSKRSLIDLISELTSIDQNEINRVDVLDTYSFFEIKAELYPTVEASMNGKMLDARVMNVEKAGGAGKGGRERSGGGERRSYTRGEGSRSGGGESRFRGGDRDRSYGGGGDRGGSGGSRFSGGDRDRSGGSRSGSGSGSSSGSGSRYGSGSSSGSGSSDRKKRY